MLGKINMKLFKLQTNLQIWVNKIFLILIHPHNNSFFFFFLEKWDF